MSQQLLHTEEEEEEAEAAASFIISSVADCSKQAQQARPFERDAARPPRGGLSPFFGGAADIRAHWRG